MMDKLVADFLDKLNEPDPPHALLLMGVQSASSWIKLLDEQSRKIIVEYMDIELSKKGDLPIKELLIKVLEQIGGQDSLALVDKVIIDGEEVHGSYLVADAKNARDKMKK